MSAFVGTQTLATVEVLQSLIQNLSNEKSCFFLKWPHKVSGFCKQLPSDFPSPEGQMFDEKQELRWRKQGKGYSVLLLSTTGAHPDFEPVGQAWMTQDRTANLYPATETRFPKGIDCQKFTIGQRDFFDTHTATVHFVALKAS